MSNLRFSNRQALAAIALLLLTATVNNRLIAQEEQQARTLFGEGTSLNTEHIGFFLAPAYGITSMDGSTASLLHLRGAVSLKDRWSLGGYYSVSLNEIRPQSETEANVYMDYWSAGGFVEYTLLAKKVLHLSFPLFLGYGEVEMDNEAGAAGLGEQNFFQIEPAALLELNLHRYVRFNLGAGYRFVGEMSYRNFDQSDLRGLTGYAGLKFGWFR